MTNLPSGRVVNENIITGTTRCEIFAIVRKLHEPNLAIGLIQYFSRSERKLVSVAHVICEERKRSRRIMIQTIPDLILFDLVKKLY